MKINGIIYTLLFFFSSFAGASQEKNNFSAYEINYALGQTTKGDSESIEVNYSFKYVLFECDKWAEKDSMVGCSSTYKLKFRWYFTYTGKFDFYIDENSRPSAPVINRTSNPAFHFNWVLRNGDASLFSFFDIGLEHRSNGQIVDSDAKDENDKFLTEINHSNGNFKYFDNLSFSTNYVKLTLGLKKYDTNVDISFKYYINHDSNITWGSLAGTNTRIHDYDLLNLSFSHKLETNFPYIPHLTARADYVIGENLLDTDSVDYYLIFPVRAVIGFRFPWFIKVHMGPMDRLSDYTKSRNSIGLGMALSY